MARAGANVLRGSGVGSLKPSPAASFIVLPDSICKIRGQHTEAMVYGPRLPFFANNSFEASPIALAFLLNTNTRSTLGTPAENSDVLADHGAVHTIDVDTRRIEPSEEVRQSCRVRAEGVARASTGH
jgi:hypothetical protein